MRTNRFNLSFLIPFLFSHHSNVSKRGYFLKILFFVLITQTVLSQNPKEKAIYDSLTYYYSENAVWDSVIDIGKESIYKGYDFYALRMRMGNAFDHQGNYRLSEKQFTKALEFKPTDTNAAFYQYQAAINGGRQDVAYHNYKSFNEAQKDLIVGENQTHNGSKLPVKLKALEQISIFSGYSFSNKQNFDEILPLTAGLLYQESQIRSHQFYAHLGLKGNISSKLTWNLSYNYNQINGNYLFREKNYPMESQKSNIMQNELFAGLSFYTGTGWSISAYGVLINYTQEKYATSVENYNYYIAAENDSILGTNPDFNKTYNKEKNNDYSIGFKLKKTIQLFDISLFASYSEMLNENPLEIGGEVTILPNGNYDFYLSNKLSYLNKSGESIWLYKVSLGGKLYKHLQYFAAANFGNLQYSSELDLGVVNNWIEPTNFKGDFGLSYPLNENLWISAHYQFYQKESNIYQNQLYHLHPSEEFEGFYEPQYKDTMDVYKFNEHFVYLGFVWYL